jgi:hypothetical protein
MYSVTGYKGKYYFNANNKNEKKIVQSVEKIARSAFQKIRVFRFLAKTYFEAL